jgi:hypothetical protein
MCCNFLCIDEQRASVCAVTAAVTVPLSSNAKRTESEVLPVVGHPNATAA